MKWNRYLGRILVLPTICLASAASAVAQQAQPFAAPQPAAEADAPPADQVVATVDGEPITKQEVRTTLEPQLQGQEVPPQQVQAMQQQVVNSLIESRLVEKYLRDNGPKVESQEVQQTIDQLDEQLESQQASMKDFLASRGYTADMLKKRIEGSIAWQKLQQQQAGDEARLQQYFAANRNQFQTEDFEAAKQQVLNAYLGAMYQGIVQETKDSVEVRILDPSLAPGRPAPQPGAPQPGAPQQGTPGGGAPR